ncbi:tRNA-splicing endonuclease subunit sen54 [Rhizina undulata]
MAEPEADNLRIVHNSQDADLSDETQDFRFLNMFKKAEHASLPRRGEKDFEPDGTDLQDSVLADSRQAMHDALLGERKHSSKVHVRATWRPCHELAEVHVAKGPHFKSLGKADRNGVLWLLPEETIYMVERGNLECWWEEGVPMSLQGVYASCLDAAGGLERYQVFAYLKRAGYILQRAPTFFPSSSSSPASEELKNEVAATNTINPATLKPGLFQHLFSTLFTTRPPPDGPLVPPGAYHSYPSIYSRLSLIPCHHPARKTPATPAPPSPPFTVTYHVWKPRPHFKKSDPPPPDFRVCVIDSRDTPVPSLSQLSALFDSLPVDDEKAVDNKNVFQRLKDGRRNVVLAVVDSGVTSFIKFSDVGFGDEKMFSRKPAGRGGKGGGRGRGGGGRGGRGGSGQGRGRGR